MQNQDSMDPGAPQREIFKILTGEWIAIALGVVAELGVADLLITGPKSTAELATSLRVQPDNLRRTLRVLACAGIFTCNEEELWSLTEVGETLKSDAKNSMRYLAMSHRQIVSTKSWERFGDVLRTGKSQTVAAIGSNIYRYYEAHPEDGNIFRHAMHNVSCMAVRSILQSYDFSGFEIAADIGGAYGAMLAGILEKYSNLRGILFDLPYVVERASSNLADVSERIEFIGGNFFKDVLPQADLYILKQILHDWNDERCLQILRNIRAAMKLGSRLLVIELTMSDTIRPEPSALLDLHMMVTYDGGRERTVAEYEQLFVKTGLKLHRVHSTPSDFSILEAVPQPLASFPLDSQTSN